MRSRMSSIRYTSAARLRSTFVQILSIVLLVILSAGIAYGQEDTLEVPARGYLDAHKDVFSARAVPSRAATSEAPPAGFESQ